MVRVRVRVGVRVRGRVGVRVRGRVGVRVRGRVGVRVRGSSARGGGPVGAVLAEGGVEAVRAAEHVERVRLAGRVPQLLDAEDLRLVGQRPPHLALELGLELERQLIAAAGGLVLDGVHHHVHRLRQRCVQLVAHAHRLGVALRQLPQPRHPPLLHCAAPRRGDGRPCRTRGGRGGEGDRAAGDMAPSAGGQGLAAAAALAALAAAAAAAESGAPWPAAATCGAVGDAGPLGVERRLPLVHAAVGQRRVAVGQRAARGAARAQLGWRRLGWRRLGWRGLGWRRRLPRALRRLPSRLLALLRRGGGRTGLPGWVHRTQHLAADDLAAAGDDAVGAAVGAPPARAQLEAGGALGGLARRRRRRRGRGDQ